METNSAHYINLITRYLFGEASPDEIRELEVWVNADPANSAIFSKHQKTWKALADTHIEQVFDADHEWSRLRSKLHDQGMDHGSFKVSSGPTRRNFNPGFLTWSLRIAAAIIILLIPAFLVYRSLSAPDMLQFTASDGTAEYTLPDGTIISLNQGGTLSCPAKFTGTARTVVLDGEAWFEVTHDAAHPFVVQAGSTRVQVVGTSFSVNTHSYGNTREIILETGKVKVFLDDPTKQMVFLDPGEKADVMESSHTIRKSMNLDENYLAWKTRRLVFNNTPLNEAAAVITKVYHTTIRLSGNRLNNCRITATFDKQSLESVLNVLKATLDLEVRNTGSGIELSGNGCHQDH